MENSCYRCDKKECSEKYKSQSTNIVTKKAKEYLGIDTHSARKQQISCCVGCISPPSRRILHNEGVFKRYEPLFLNYILANLHKAGLSDNINKKLNVGEENKKDRYDLLLTRSDNKINLLVEIDETSPHWNNQANFHQDREREKRFLEKYGNESHIIRIRVGDENNKIVSCVAKEDGYCYVDDKKLFEFNMNLVTKYITELFSNYKSIKHAYIDFSEKLGIRDFKKVFEQSKGKKNYIYDPRPDKKTSRENEEDSDMNDITEKMKKQTLKETKLPKLPKRCNYEDGRGQCRRDCEYRSKYCENHK